MCVPVLSCFLCVDYWTVCICDRTSMCHVHACSLCMCMFSTCQPNGSDGVSLSVWVNPHHLAMIGSFLLYWNPKWLNHTSYGKQSISGSGIHCFSKPQIAPIKALVWHARTNTQLFDLIWLVSVWGHSLSFSRTPQSSPVFSQSPGFSACCWTLSRVSVLICARVHTVFCVLAIKCSG